VEQSAIGLASANLDTQLASILSSEATPPTVAQIDAQLTSTHGAGAWGSGGNGGTLSLTYTLVSSVDNVTPIPRATVELYAESAMTTIIESGITNDFGVVVFSNLVAGTYYLKRIKSGWTFTNPDTETVA